jgi:hypothetical protein
MLINFSNHSSRKWSAQQTSLSVQQYGHIIDLPFPNVDPVGDGKYIEMLTAEYLEKIDTLVAEQLKNVDTVAEKNGSVVVHIMGEFTFCFAMVTALQKKDICCISSTTERICTEKNGRRTYEFRFCRFRDYIN